MSITRGGFLFIVLVFSGCATGVRISDRDSASLFEDACRPGAKASVVEGSIWIRTKSTRSPNESGQFPADVRVSEKDGLLLQVTNLVGGREAEIRVTTDEVKINGQRPVREGGNTGTWGGIPLRFAPELFLGRVPCPPLNERKGAKVSFEGDRELRVDTASETYLYRYRELDRRLIPSHVEWRSGGISIEFLLDDIELATGSARKWEARGPAGEVKVKWRERRVEDH